MRTIAITGSASGIGAAASRLLREAGEQVIGIDLHDAEIEADLGLATGRAHVIEQVRALCEGHLDGLVTCAGLSSAVHDESRVLAVNFFGTAELLRGLRPLLARGDRPAAVAVASWAMLQPTPLPEAIAACLAFDEPRALELVTGDPRAAELWPAYATSKSAVARLVRQLAPQAEWAGCGITLNAIVPSVTRTPMIARHLASAAATQALLAVAPSPMGRMAEPEEVADPIAYLVSGRARQLTGQAIFVDGGLDALRRPFDTLLPLTPERWR
jgi:NAD(P)-dependent dehydrogenase (short-subunit alcohol dehydrogenase family)